MTERPRLRKRPLEADAATTARADEIDIAGCASIAYSSEVQLTRLRIYSTDAPALALPVGSAPGAHSIRAGIGELLRPPQIQPRSAEMEHIATANITKVRVRTMAAFPLIGNQNAAARCPGQASMGAQSLPAHIGDAGDNSGDQHYRHPMSPHAIERCPPPLLDAA
jgi:hypothetical protein